MGTTALRSHAPITGLADEADRNLAALTADLVAALVGRSGLAFRIRTWRLSWTARRILHFARPPRWTTLCMVVRASQQRCCSEKNARRELELTTHLANAAVRRRPHLDGSRSVGSLNLALSVALMLGIAKSSRRDQRNPWSASFEIGRVPTRVVLAKRTGVVQEAQQT